jgi:CDP-4-dehydro-6-deoxyglucose reductase
MPQLLTLSRAARLVGIARGALQQRVKDGELPTFEGMVAAADLVRLYPHARFEDDSAIERAREIREQAYANRLRERILPDPATLAVRLNELAHVLADTRAELARLQQVVGALKQRLHTDAPDTQALRQWLEAALATEPPDTSARELMAKDSVLRVMAAHVHVLPSQHDFFVEGNDSILEAALRSGLSLAYGCSNGNCGECKARLISGETRKLRNHDYSFSETEKAQGYLLLCSHTAVTDLILEASEGGDPADIPLQHIATRVKALTPLGAEMLLLHVQTPRANRLRFLAGQSATLQLDGVRADLPIASCPCDDRNLQFHLRRDAGDAFSERVRRGLRPADVVELEGPRGAFVLNDHSPRALIFIAFDNGFAPIKSLIEHAMALDIAASLHLYWVTASAEGQYLANHARAWADALDNFYYLPVMATAETAAAALAEPLRRNHPNLGDYDAYVAGPTAALEPVRQWLLQAGLPGAQLSTLALD